MAHTKTERNKRKRVFERYTAMKDSELRKEAELDWDFGDKNYQQYIPKKANGDWRANLVLPDGFAAIESHQQESLERYSRPFISPVENSDAEVEQLGNDLMNYNMDRTGFDYQQYLARKVSAIRGTSFLMERYKLEKRTVRDPVSIDEDGELVYETREIVDMDDTYTEWIDNEFIYIDEGARHIDYAIDMVHREVMHIDEFKRKYGGRKGYHHVDEVQAAGETAANVHFFQRAEDMTDQDVELLHYFNRGDDSYDLLVNNYLVFTGPIPFRHKELPIGVFTFYDVPGRIYGMGIPRVIMPLTEERQALRRIALDRTKLKINQMFISNSLFDLDEEDLISRPGGLIEVDTNGLPLSQVMQPLDYGDTPSSYYRMEDIILEDIRRATGIDDRVQGVNVGGTAFEAALLKEQSQKRINMINRLAEMDTLTRVGRLKWSNIKFFYPIPKVERIVSPNNEVDTRNSFRNIKVKGRSFSLYKEEGMEEEKLLSTDVNGFSMLKLTKEFSRFLDGDWDVTVKASAHVVLSKPLQQAKVNEMFTLLALNPNLIKEVDIPGAVRRFVEINEEDPEVWTTQGGKTDQDWMELAERENVLMSEGNFIESTKDATELHTLMHLQFTETTTFEKLDDKTQALFMDHIVGEHENNPATGTAGDLQGLGGAGGGAANPIAGGLPVNKPPVDMQSSSIVGEAGDDQSGTEGTV